MDIKLDIGFRTIKEWTDSDKRAVHVFDRMLLRGVGGEQIRDAVKMGAKNLREDGTIMAEFRWFKVIYREFKLKDVRKIYPITVIEV